MFGCVNVFCEQLLLTTTLGIVHQPESLFLCVFIAMYFFFSKLWRFSLLIFPKPDKIGLVLQDFIGGRWGGGILYNFKSLSHTSIKPVHEILVFTVSDSSEVSGKYAYMRCLA